MKTKLIVWMLLPLLLVAIYFARVRLESQRSVLETSEQFTLYSLSPNPGGDGPGERFHRFPVLGKTVISDGQVKRKLIDALYKSIPEASGAASCHMPRHGIRAVKGSRTLDLTICFACENIYFYDYGRMSYSEMSASAKPVFNAVLVENHVPLSKD